MVKRVNIIRKYKKTQRKDTKRRTLHGNQTDRTASKSRIEHCLRATDAAYIEGEFYRKDTRKR